MSSDEFKQKGNKAFAQKNFELAIECFTKAIETAPAPNHALYSNRSAAYASMKQFDKALEDAHKTVEINPTWAKGYSRVAAAEFGLGKLEDAEKSYSKTLELDPSNKAAKEGLESVQHAIQQQSGGPGNQFAQIFNDPQMMEKLAKNPKTAEMIKDPVFLQKLIRFKQNPQMMSQEIMSDPRFMTVMGVLLGIDIDMKEREVPEEPTASSASSAPKAQQETPKDADGDVKVEDAPAPEPEPVDTTKEEADKVKAEANKLYKARKFDEAIELYNKAWDLHQDVTYLNNRAAAEFEKGDYETTIKTCENAVEKARELRSGYQVVAKSLARIGTTHLKQKKYKEAIEYFEKALTEHRTPDVLSKLRSTQKLLKELEANAYVDPEKAEEARLQGKEYFTKADWPNAVKAYTEMIKRAPQDARGYSNRAAALAKLMSFPEAVRDSAEAIKKDPNFIRAYIRKANAEIALKEYSKAIETLDEARKKDAEVNKSANSREIEQLYSKAYSQRFQPVENETPEQTFERVSKDPEVSAILQDPIMNTILSQARDDPSALQEHMKNPEVAKKIQVLMLAGIIRTR